MSDSFSIAKEALKASPFVANSNLEGDKFVLLPEELNNESNNTTVTTPRSNSRRLHSHSIFSTNTVAQWPQPGQCVIGSSRCDVAVFLARCKLPSPPADFEGREVVMHTLIKHIIDKRLVSLVGEDGVGKTSVASAVCKYLVDRDIFDDSVLFLRAKGLKDFKSFLKALERTLLSSSVLGATMLAVVEKDAVRRGADAIYIEEDAILECLESRKLLLVLDNLDDLTSKYSEYADETITDLRLFLSRLIQRCPQVKLLVVSTDTLNMNNIAIPGVVENSVMLGPLTLYSSLRLFARLAPSLSTSFLKTQFIEDFLLKKHIHTQYHLTWYSKELSSQGRALLELFGFGHPSKIVLMACESTAESMDKLRQRAQRIIEPYPLLK